MYEDMQSPSPSPSPHQLSLRAVPEENTQARQLRIDKFL